MSLVNDALKKARMEAARKDVARSGVPYPALGRGEQMSSTPRNLGVLAVVLLVGLGGFLLFRAGRQSALEGNFAQASRGAEPELSEPEVSQVIPADSGTPAQVETQSVAAAATPAPPQPAAASGTAVGSSNSPQSSSSRLPSGQAPEPRRDRPAPVAKLPEAIRTGASESAARTDPEPRGVERREEDQTPGPTPTRSAEAPPTAAEADAEPRASSEYLRSAEIPGVGPIELGGIAWSGDRPFALVNGRVVRPGDSVSGLIVEEIRPNTLRLSGSAGDLVFRLK